MQIFDFINEICYSKTKWDTFSEKDKKIFNSYMINRIMSMNVNYIDIVNIISKYKLENQTLYNFYIGIIPKQKIYSKYIKNNNKSKNQELINILCKYWECSSREVKENLEILSKDDIIKILKSIGKADKEIKTLIK